MILHPTKLNGTLLFQPKVFGDERGFFMETWNAQRYREFGLDQAFVQDNLSRSRRGVLRGLHFQKPDPQGKLVYVLEGEVFDVAVDIRRGSPTFGQWEEHTLSADNKLQFYIPAGFAHGFCVTSETALFAYKCTELYHPASEGCVAWNDPDLNIPWPIEQPELSTKDAKGINLADYPIDKLPEFE
ncbi:dTDP-4-dehydrorhamnose 3,5-epimerase [Halothiobacillus sp.]|uniref:dTDP-4-dehydrorhamnose 3,5-epimerase n=1 Tax=Halothiobacillus sp. TaxID=1891311 RepID=UPI002628D0D3|nr:dTDP-4-dehydrorhamnose 3,5-epimerase [Halothiobacillus sp.]